MWVRSLALRSFLYSSLTIFSERVYKIRDNRFEADFGQICSVVQLKSTISVGFDQNLVNSIRARQTTILGSLMGKFVATRFDPLYPSTKSPLTQICKSKVYELADSIRQNAYSYCFSMPGSKLLRETPKLYCRLTPMKVDTRRRLKLMLPMVESEMAASGFSVAQESYIPPPPPTSSQSAHPLIAGDLVDLPSSSTAGSLVEIPDLPGGLGNEPLDMAKNGRIFEQMARDGRVFEQIVVQPRRKTVIVVSWGTQPVGVDRGCYVPNGFRCITHCSGRNFIGETSVNTQSKKVYYRFIDRDTGVPGSWACSPCHALNSANDAIHNDKHYRGTNARLVIGVTYPTLQQRIGDLFKLEPLLIPGRGSSDGDDDDGEMRSAKRAARAPRATKAMKAAAAAADAAEDAAGAGEPGSDQNAASSLLFLANVITNSSAPKTKAAKLAAFKQSTAEAFARKTPGNLSGPKTQQDQQPIQQQQLQQVRQPVQISRVSPKSPAFVLSPSLAAAMASSTGSRSMQQQPSQMSRQPLMMPMMSMGRAESEQRGPAIITPMGDDRSRSYSNASAIPLMVPMTSPGRAEELMMERASSSSSQTPSPFTLNGIPIITRQHPMMISTPGDIYSNGGSSGREIQILSVTDRSIEPTLDSPHIEAPEGSSESKGSPAKRQRIGDEDNAAQNLVEISAERESPLSQTNTSI